MCEVLKALDEPTIIGDFFVELLDARSSLQGPMLPRTESLVILLSEVMLVMLDKFGDQVLRNNYQILKFVRSLLLDSDDTEGLFLGLTLLNQVFSEIKVSLHGDVQLESILKEIRIILQSLSGHSVEPICKLALEARLKISSIHVATDSSEENRKESESKLVDALEDLSNAMLPVRAHGMSKLIAMVKENDSIALENLQSISTIFLDVIDDEDSFIYLHAVKGLHTIADLHPSQILPSMIERYGNASFSVSYWHRIGEAFRNIIQRAGTALQAHCGILLKKVLVVLSTHDNEIVISALSLLGDIADSNALALVPYIGQIFDYLDGVLVLEMNVIVRRGALVAIHCILSNLGPSLVSNASLRVLETLQTRVEYVQSTDKDGLSRNHAKDIIALWRGGV